MTTFRADKPACRLCGNQGGDLVAIYHIDDEIIYICRHGHIEAMTYDVVTGLPAHLTLGEHGSHPDLAIDDVLLLLSGNPDSPNEFDGLGDIIE